MVRYIEKLSRTSDLFDNVLFCNVSVWRPPSGSAILGLKHCKAEENCWVKWKLLKKSLVRESSAIYNNSGTVSLLAQYILDSTREHVWPSSQRSFVFWCKYFDTRHRLLNKVKVMQVFKEPASKKTRELYGSICMVIDDEFHFEAEELPLSPVSELHTNLYVC